MNRAAADLNVRKAITVEVSQERAFEVFTTEIGSWWPLTDKAIGSAKAETAVLEPQTGGRWYERGVDGSECEWGTVLAFEASARLVLDWQISAHWTFDPELHTEIEIRFIAEGDERTRVELEHRGLEAYGDDAEQLRAIFESPSGWSEILGRFEKQAV